MFDGATVARNETNCPVCGALVPINKSICELVLGRSDWDEGNRNSAILHLQRSVCVAMEVGDWERVCWAQLRLLLMIADRSGPAAIAGLLN